MKGSISSAFRFKLTGSKNKLNSRIVAMIVATLCVILLLSAILLNVQMGYAVYMNGEELGEAKDLNDVENIVSSAEEKLTELLGYDYSLDNSISVSTKIVPSKNDNTDSLENAIIVGVEDVVTRAVIRVNGVVVGTLESDELANDLLTSILNKYRFDGVTDIRFAEEVTVTTEYVKDDIQESYSAIYSALNPENAYSDNSLTVIATGSRMHEEVIPFDVEYRDDDTLYENSMKLITAGQNGTKVISESFTCINGVETECTVTGELITKKPVTEIAQRGTAERPATASNGIYIWPCTGTLTSYFGYRDDVDVGSNNHRGLDIADSIGTRIVAADGGEVIVARYLDSYGNFIKIRHDNGDCTWYAHCSELLVEEGDLVAQGELIAYMGDTGDTTGAHLHFEIHPGGGTAVDPLCYLPW